jgi:hypothetical protein
MTLLVDCFLASLEHSLVLNMWPYFYMAKISSHCFQPFGSFGLCEGIITDPWEDELSFWSDLAKVYVFIYIFLDIKKSMANRRGQKRHKHDVFSDDLKDKNIAWLYHMPLETRV